MTPRALRLDPWLVRTVIPQQRIGTYVLFTAAGEPLYIGRSDSDVRRRLLRHCYDRRGDYFTYDVHPTVASAYDVECALFHILAPSLTNRIHPDRPDFHPSSCVFCRASQRETRSMRIQVRSQADPDSRRTSASEDRR